MSATILLLCLLGPGSEASTEGLDLFERKIRPVLVEHCQGCHSADASNLKAGLRLDHRQGLLDGGDSGPALVPGHPEKSRIIAALRYRGPEMPPRRRLPERVVRDFERWISLGAPDPREAPESSDEAEIEDPDRGRDHWAFQPLDPGELPDVRDASWPRVPLDHHVLAGLETEGLRPAPEADRRTLLRRLTAVLTGLVPTPAEVEAFVNDPDPGAYEKQVERLLASPRHGEHLARLWLDLARYAEDQAHIVGNNKSLFYPNAHLYREWVIEALNENLPYDRFVRLQLAVDLTEPDNRDDLPALGFMGLGPKYYNRGNPLVKADEWEDRVDTFSRGLLGLTVACARCHDHKFDPVSTEDYYALAGVFASVKMRNLPLESWRPESASATEVASTGDENASGSKKESAKKKPKGPEISLHIIEEGKPVDLRVHVRGDPGNLGDTVPRRFLEILGGSDESRFREGSGRAELAEALFSSDNPLTARVMANRLWGWILGKPLVGTPSNFGVLGEPPTHPRLLDHLAERLVDSGWSLRDLQRELVLSATFRQSTRAAPGARERDPDNRGWGRARLRRRSIESWRDGILELSRGLDTRLGGESVEILDPASRRRTVYARVSRFELDGLLALYDFPDPNIHAARRVETTTPLQKLFGLNSPFMVEQARALASRLDAELPAEGSAEEVARRRIEWLYRELFQRSPDPREIEPGLAYLLGPDPGTGRDLVVEYAHALLASNEMLYLD